MFEGTFSEANEDNRGKPGSPHGRGSQSLSDLARHPPQPQHSRIREAQAMTSQMSSACRIQLLHKQTLCSTSLWACTNTDTN